MLYLLITIIIIFDQWVKMVIRSNFYVYQSKPIINNFFHLTYVQNTGAGFGIFAGQRVIFLVISTIVIFILFFYRSKRKKNLVLELAIGLIVGGAIGNFIDRVWFGFVTDYLDFRIWPIFNIADSAVVVGAIIFIYYIWKVEEMR